MTQQGTTPTVTESRLADLTARVGAARLWTSNAKILGVAPDRMASLVERWQTFDWRAVEAQQAAFGARITRTADGRTLHYLHRAGSRDGGSAGLPILLLHGWPDSPLQFRAIIPALLAAGHPVVAPTAAGFGFSEAPATELSPDLVASDFLALMTELGYERFVIHGTDWGATVGAAIAGLAPKRVAGLHFLQPPFDRAFLVDRSTASESELVYLTQMDAWSESAAYVSAHLHQADTLAAAFADSPVGLLAWLAERYDAWSGRGVADEDILAAASLMWLTDTFRSSVRLYSEPAASWDGGDSWGEADSGSEPGGDVYADADGGAWASRIEVPTAFAIFPDDIGIPPRDFCDRFFAIVRYTVMPHGGHWAAGEEPDLVVEDLLDFAASLRIISA